MLFEERRVLARAGRSAISASRIEGTFPNYEEVVPGKCQLKATVEKDGFAACVRRGALLATEGSHAVAIRFSPGQLQVGAKVSNVGEGEIRMDIDYGGDPVEIHFNPKYLLDFLKIAEGDTVTVEMHDPGSAVVFRDSAGMLYVVMPITLEAGG